MLKPFEAMNEARLEEIEKQAEYYQLYEELNRRQAKIDELTRLLVEADTALTKDRVELAAIKGDLAKTHWLKEQAEQQLAEAVATLKRADSDHTELEAKLAEMTATNPSAEGLQRDIKTLAVARCHKCGRSLPSDLVCHWCEVAAVVDAAERWVEATWKLSELGDGAQGERYAEASKEYHEAGLELALAVCDLRGASKSHKRASIEIETEGVQ